MAWPVNSIFQTIQSGVTRIGYTLLGSVQSGVSRLYGGDASVVRLTVDGQGNASGQAASGDIYVTSGRVIAGGSIIAPNFVASGAGGAVGGNVTAYGNVLGSKLLADGGATGLQFYSGATLYAYHTTGTAQTSGAGGATAISIPVPSGKAVVVVARGVGIRTDMIGAAYNTIMTGYVNSSGNGTLVSMGPSSQNVGFPFGIPSGTIAALGTSTSSGTLALVPNGPGSGLMNWTVYADVTLTP